jgi:hypothetical protein
VERENVSRFFESEDKNIVLDQVELWFEISEALELWKHGDIRPTDIYTSAFVPKDPVWD